MRTIAPYLLNLVYALVLVAVSPWLVWQAVTKGKYREGFCHKVLGRVPLRKPGKKCLWLHGVSVGEINLLETLVKQIHEQRPGWQCVISTTTLTGMALARKKFPGLNVFYCPLDFSWAVRRAMHRIAPDVLVLAELELWPNLIQAAKEIGAKVAIINGRLSENSFKGYRKIKPLLRPVLRQIDLVAAQNDAYAGRFHCLGVTGGAIHVTGSIKFDGAETDRSNQKTVALRSLAGITDDDMIFLAGSTQEPEEAMSLRIYRDLSKRFPQLRLILVPRHPHRFDAVARLLDESGILWQRRTELDACTGVKTPHTNNTLETPDLQADDSEEDLSPDNPAPRVLLIDTIGELGAWWGTAHVAFVGGSMGSRGGQNMIEPAAYGAAVSFGPNTSNFRDIVSLILDQEAAEVVEDEAALSRFVERCLEDEAYRVELGQRANALVREQLGAAGRTIELLDNLVCPQTEEKSINPRLRNRAA